MEIDRLDHLVMTVRSIEATRDFYARVLGMRVETFGSGRVALCFGDQKINLHEAGREFAPYAGHPTPGSADFCLTTRTPLERVMEELRERGVEIVDGPVMRTGARRPIRSIYLRDPDENLVEIANEVIGTDSAS
jgi:catechol 2,3-dioxygenase-like lactoylglutathione lyase family enzyme